jgi:metal-responsive CopG/Arc/MetJ family transcriptional regulator
MRMANEPEKQYVNVLFDVKLLSRVEDFRFKHRFPSRTEAIRWLLDHALKQKPVPPEQKGE